MSLSLPLPILYSLHSVLLFSFLSVLLLLFVCPSGLVDPAALPQAVAAFQAAHFIGMPECEVRLTQLGFDRTHNLMFKQMSESFLSLLYLSFTLHNSPVFHSSLPFPSSPVIVSPLLTLMLPHSQVILAQCVVYLARAPKSVEVYKAYSNVKACLRNHRGPLPPVPLHLRNAPTRLMKNLGYSKGYKYNPAFSSPVDQDYLPEELRGLDFFTWTPTDQ